MKNETETKPVDLNRRRLTKSGLAAPVVLASLASKNALASVPYRCTISGKLSGGSTHSTTEGTCDFGKSPTEWSDTNKNQWAANLMTGNNIKLFSDIFSYTGFYKLKKKALPTDPDEWVAANLKAVAGKTGITDSLGNPFSDTALLDFAADAVATIANYWGIAPDFPLTNVQIVAMFNTTYGNSSTYPYSPTVDMDRAAVQAYFKFLYNGV